MQKGQGESKSLKIAISGASGFIGSELTRVLTAKGHEVRRIVRTRPTLNSSSEIYWNPESTHIESHALDGIDVVINLAGKNLAAERWTRANKALLKDSRIKSTKLLAHSLSRLKKPPRLFLSASASGFYGNRGDEILSESAKPGTGFLAQLCREWELATWEAEAIGTTVNHLRFGMVLSPSGGALKKLLPYYRFGLGGVIGSGEQYLSWVTRNDLVAAITFLIEHPQPNGAINISSPNPITNREFTRALAKAVRRPAPIHISASFLRVLFGEMGEATLLDSQRLVPTKLTQAGFEFKDPEITAALIKMLRTHGTTTSNRAL